MVRNIVGFAGRKRSGKGVLTEAIQNHVGLENTEVVTIASFLKDLCCQLIGLSTIKELNSIKDNGTVLNVRMTSRWVDILQNVTNIPRHSLEDEMQQKGVIYDVRELLQYIGTDIIRKYEPSWHVNQMKKKILSIPAEKMIIIDDVRFPNEVKALTNMGAIIYFIVRPSCLEVSNHVSETSLNWSKFAPEQVILNISPLQVFQQTFINYHFNKESSTKSKITAVDTNPLIEGESNFGLRLTKKNQILVDDIISQNLLRGSYTDGKFYYNPTDPKLRKQFIKSVGYDNENGKVITIKNPLIIENLKQYI